MTEGSASVAEGVRQSSRLLENSPANFGASGWQWACMFPVNSKTKTSRQLGVLGCDAIRESERAFVGVNAQEGPDEEAITGAVSHAKGCFAAYTGHAENQITGSWRREGLTESDLGNLNAVLDHEIAANTVANYRVQWRYFVLWTLEKEIRAFPADPSQVAAYLAERIERHGHKPATLRMAASAIAFVHKNAGLDDPCASQEVKRTLRSATRKWGRCQKQAEGLTADALAVIQETAREPRLGRGGRLEGMETATSRGNLDIALISLMRDAMLRVSEAADLTWEDLEDQADGTGRLLIRRSKTDADGEGAIAFVSTETMETLKLMRGKSADTSSIFGLRPNQISKRIKQAAQVAGLGDGFSGHSPRVGMAQDLARAGTELPSLMNAGRWRNPAMPAHYTRNEAAGKGAVAQFHGHRSRTP